MMNWYRGSDYNNCTTLLLMGALWLSLSVSKPVAADETPKAKAPANDGEASSSLLEMLEQRLLEQDKKIEEAAENSKRQQALIEAQKAEIEQIKSRQDQAEESAMSQAEDDEIASMMEEEESRQRLRFFGFSDFSLSKMWVNKSATIAPFFNDNLSFALVNLNLFMDHQLTDSFRYMAEVRFSALPQGSVQIAGTEVFYRDNNVLDPVTMKMTRWGSISVVRAFVEYHPMDYFALRIGRFLTPYGIWNVDHATPLIIAGRTPSTMMTGVVPEAQTGLYLFGHAYPVSKLRLDYGFTLSNGRGPFDEILDLDDNKGLGLRVRLGWDGDYKLYLGAYLYMGDYTNSKKKLVTLDPVKWGTEKTECYSEKTAAFDLLFEYKGFRLQGEYLIASRVFHDQKRGKHFFTQALLPDYYSQGMYVLMAYRLPFNSVDLRPYLMFDRVDIYDFSDEWIQNVPTVGINWRINPHIVLKIEYWWVLRGDSLELHGINNQLAVSF